MELPRLTGAQWCGDRPAIFGSLRVCPKGHAATKLGSALLTPFFQPTSSGLLLRDTGQTVGAPV
jgi:hypothetical protein